jgi:hypothetical protein
VAFERLGSLEDRRFLLQGSEDADGPGSQEAKRTAAAARAAKRLFDIGFMVLLQVVDRDYPGVQEDAQTVVLGDVRVELPDGPELGVQAEAPGGTLTPQELGSPLEDGSKCV